jgi:hypothetical protein
MFAFYYPATFAELMRANTWLSDVCIENTVRRRMQDGEPFTVLAVNGPNNSHYHVRPVPGHGFRVRRGPLRPNFQSL